MDIASWIDRHATFTPEKTAIRFRGDEVARDITYKDLAAEIETLAAALVNGLHVTPGDRIAYLGYNSIEMIALLFACARQGAILVPLNWRLATPEHRYQMRDCTPKALFVGAQFTAQVDAQRDIMLDAQAITLGTSPNDAWQPYEDLLIAHSGSVTPRVGTPDSAVLIGYTSGTTGHPKGAVLSQNALLTNALNSTHMHDLTSADRILTTLPMFHVGGLNILTLPALHAGASVVLHDKFDPQAALDDLPGEKISLTVFVPAQISALLAHPQWMKTDISSLRIMSTGSTLVPDTMVRAIHERDVPVIQVYGATETAPLATYLRAEDAEAGLGSGGKPALHCEVKVVAPNGADTATGQPGEIWVRGGNVMSQYWNNPRATAASLTDGWFHTGDVGHFDERGFLYVDDRIKDMIISGGENIYPAALDNILAECTDIAEGVVVGQPDDKWGEVPVAVVAPASGAKLTADSITNLFVDRTARYTHPRRVVFVDALPRNAMGKVKKDEVRKMIKDVNA